MDESQIGQPWDRRPREPEKAWDGFALYRDSPAPRSIKATAAALGKSESLLKKWSVEYGWKERCRAYDLHLDAHVQSARDRSERASAETWAGRREKVREAEFSIAAVLFGKARALLRCVPVPEPTAGADAGEAIKSALAAMRAAGVAGEAAKLAESASRLAAKALGDPRRDPRAMAEEGMDHELAAEITEFALRRRAERGGPAYDPPPE